LDCGNIDNFIQLRLAHHLRLPIELVSEFLGAIGKWRFTNGKNIIAELYTLKVQHQEVSKDQWLDILATINYELAWLFHNQILVHSTDW